MKEKKFFLNFLLKPRFFLGANVWLELKIQITIIYLFNNIK